MDTVNSPHDKLFANVFSKLENARSFMRTALPSEIVSRLDFRTLKDSDIHFVDHQLKANYSDLLFTIQTKADSKNVCVYILFEHKCESERFTVLQILGYILRLWEKFAAETGKLPMVLPLIFYHGVTKWSSPLTIAELLDIPKGFNEFIPNFKFLLHDLSGVSEHEIRGNVEVRIIQLLFKYVFDHDLIHKLPGIMALLNELKSKRRMNEYLETLVRYLISTSSGLKFDDLNTIVKTAFSEEGGKTMQTIAQQLKEEGEQKGKLEGLLEGEQKGKLEGKFETAQKMLGMGIPMEIIIKATELPEAKIKALLTEKPVQQS